MLRTILVTVLALLVMGSSRAFCPSPGAVANVQWRSSSPQASSTTAIGLFWNKKSNAEDTKGKAADAKAKKSSPAKNKASSVASDEKKEEPFILLYGRPEYNWVTGKTIPHGTNKKKHNWLNKSPKK